jgi:hypothetical protein
MIFGGEGAMFITDWFFAFLGGVCLILIATCGDDLRFILLWYNILMKTGDLILFNGNEGGFWKIFASALRWGTHSNYTHVAVILKDPAFLHPNLKGTYVWESSWEGKPDPQDGKIKLGVQITPLHEILETYKSTGGTALLREVKCSAAHFSEENLKRVHDVVYRKPYDIVPLDWVEGLVQKDPNPQKTSRFWCSALVGYIYTQCGLLETDTNWSILRPSDFSMNAQNLKFKTECSLSNNEKKLF